MLYRTQKQWRALRDEKWKLFGASMRRLIRAGGLPDLSDAAPGVVLDYTIWKQANEEAGPLTGTVQSQRVALYDRRTRIRDKMPLYLRTVPHEQLPDEYDHIKEQLEDIAWRLQELRKPPKPIADDWNTTCNPRTLARRLAKYERYLRTAGGPYAGTPQATELAQTVDRVRDRLRKCQLDDYEMRLNLWRADHAEDPVAYPPKSIPKRPWWWALEQKEEAVRERRERHIPLKPLPPDPHQVRLAAAQAASDARTSRLAARKHTAHTARIKELLDWAWGECRLMHIGELVETEQGAWLYVDDAHGIPRASTPTRAAALAACSVRLTTGWAFPPETARGRVL